MPFVSRGKKRQHDMRLSPHENMKKFFSDRLTSLSEVSIGASRRAKKRTDPLLTTTRVGPSSLFRVASAGVPVRACRPPHLIFSCVSPTAASVVVSLNEYN